MKARAFTLVELMATLAVATVLVGGAMVFFNVLSTRAYRISVIERDESRNDLAVREISDAIKRAKDIALFDDIGSIGGTRVTRGNVLGVQDADTGLWAYYYFTLQVDSSARDGTEAALRAQYASGSLYYYAGGEVRGRLLVPFCSLTTTTLFDLDLGIPRGRWETNLAAFRGRTQQALRSKIIVMAAPLRMR